MKRNFLHLVTYILLYLLVAIASGCSDNNTDSSEDIDYGSEPSSLTVQEGLKRLSIGLSTAIYKNRVKTTPILIGNSKVLHWRMKDGSIWTKCEVKSNDFLIIGYKYEENL